MKSFLKLAAEELVRDSKLLKINEIIDWRQLRLILKKIDRSGLGLSGYDRGPGFHHHLQIQKSPDIDWFAGKSPEKYQSAVGGEKS
ncbi:MAG: hypothetical protein LBE13_14745 [Bacteroidales bacterium]|jgi:hypothetical protein|nr:hypothetical protein [Bacteroidales bacterium]